MTDLQARVEGIVHEPTQVHTDRVDLTVSDVFRVEEAGRIDFGGGELADAALEPVGTERRSPDDDYGWWNLESGQYLLAFNESIAGEAPLLVQPRDELLERGGTLPTIRTSTIGTLPLTVADSVVGGTGGSGGPALRIKENARVATVLEP